MGQTLSRLAADGVSEFATGIDELIYEGGMHPRVAPKCVIFHVSRCGSTLLSNALRSGDGVIGLSEAPILWDAVDSAECDHHSVKASPTNRPTAILDAVVRLYSARAKGRQAQVVIKTHPENARHMRIYRAAWPEVPFLVLIRKPDEVLASNLSRRAHWMQSRFDRLRLFPSEPQRPDDKTFCALSINEHMENLLRGLDDRSIVVDYSELSREVIEELIRRCGLDEMIDRTRLITALATYSKDVRRSRPFTPAPLIEESQYSDIPEKLQSTLQGNYAKLLSCQTRLIP